MAGGPDAPQPRSMDRGKRTALLVIDMFNGYDHDDAEQLRHSAEAVVPVLTDLLRRAREAGCPVIYVNDNQGRWDTDASGLIELARSTAPAELIDPLLPQPGEAFIAKARHSVFFNSSLQYLLETEQLGRLILTGQVTEQCILYSALDAYLRHFTIAVPRDAVAHISSHLADAALEMMERNMHAHVVRAAELEF